MGEGWWGQCGKKRSQELPPGEIEMAVLTPVTDIET